jgi:hypothetical protein
MKKSFFISAGFASVNKGRCESGLSGQRHVKMFRCGWAVSFAGRRRTEYTSEDRKAKQTAADQYFRHAAARPREQNNKAKTFNNTCTP